MAKRPIVALIYDFDGTLSPGNMQEFGFIQAVGKTKEEFWKMSDGIAVGQDASNVLAYMKLMFDEARKAGIPLRRSKFKEFGKHIELFDGVKEWFGMVNEYGALHQLFGPQGNHRRLIHRFRIQAHLCGNLHLWRERRGRMARHRSRPYRKDPVPFQDKQRHHQPARFQDG